MYTSHSSAHPIRIHTPPARRPALFKPLILSGKTSHYSIDPSGPHVSNEEKRPDQKCTTSEIFLARLAWVAVLKTSQPSKGRPLQTAVLQDATPVAKGRPE